MNLRNKITEQAPHKNLKHENRVPFKPEQRTGAKNNLMSKKIVIALGSPRKKGNSAALAAELSRGSEEKGAQVTSFYLNGMKIRPCQDCRSCKKENANGCVIQDDMQEIYPAVREADAIVMASPIYWFNFSAQSRLFLDRCFALWNAEDNIFKHKSFALLLSYGDVDPFASGAVNAIRSMQDVCNYSGAAFAGAVYGSASDPGEIKENREVMTKAYELGVTLAI